jgi:hypothetical protein
MTVIVRAAGNIGPFKSVVDDDDKLVCDGVHFPKIVLGEYTLTEDDGLAPIPPPVEEEDTERDAELHALKLKLITDDAGHMATIDAALAALDNSRLSQRIKADWQCIPRVTPKGRLSDFLRPLLGKTQKQWNKILRDA